MSIFILEHQADFHFITARADPFFLYHPKPVYDCSIPPTDMLALDNSAVYFWLLAWAGEINKYQKNGIIGFPTSIEFYCWNDKNLMTF